MAKVREMQVCGSKVFKDLESACLDYVNCSINEVDGLKLHFSIEMDDGTTKTIIFRQEDDCIHVYGNFEGMLNYQEWLKLHGRIV